MATLRERILFVNGVDEKEILQRKERYKKSCIEHWKKHEDEIIRYLAMLQLQGANDGKVFISFMNLEVTPFRDIPVYPETNSHNNTKVNLTNNFLTYLKYLGIDAELVGRTDFSGCEKSYKENGVNILLSSNVPE